MHGDRSCCASPKDHGAAAAGKQTRSGGLLQVGTLNNRTGVRRRIRRTALIGQAALPKALTRQDVVHLRRKEVERAGGQVA
jgi:hypothetical protein